MSNEVNKKALGEAIKLIDKYIKNTIYNINHSHQTFAEKIGDKTFYTLWGQGLCMPNVIHKPLIEIHENKKKCTLILSNEYRSDDIGNQLSSRWVDNENDKYVDFRKALFLRWQLMHHVCHILKNYCVWLDINHEDIEKYEIQIANHYEVYIDFKRSLYRLFVSKILEPCKIEISSQQANINEYLKDMILTLLSIVLRENSRISQLVSSPSDYTDEKEHQNLASLCQEIAKVFGAKQCSAKVEKDSNILKIVTKNLKIPPHVYNPWSPPPSKEFTNVFKETFLELQFYPFIKKHQKRMTFLMSTMFSARSQEEKEPEVYSSVEEKLESNKCQIM